MNRYIYHNNEQDFILPYIIAPIATLQDTIILGSEIIKNSESHFIGEIDAEISIGDMFTRAVKYKDFFNLYITFSTACEEKNTGRRGLKLTIGFLIKNEILEKINVKGLFEYFIDKLNKVLCIDVFNYGAEQLIEDLKNEKLDLSPQLENLYSYFSGLEKLLKIKSKKRVLFLVFKKKTPKQSKFPSLILIPQRNRKQTHLEKVLLFFEIVNDNIKNCIDISTFEDKGKFLRIISCLPEKMEKIHCKKNYIEIYMT